jgi:hypothetical protein
MKKIIVIPLLILSFIMMLLFFSLYLYNFHNYGLSDNNSDWGNFGSYLNGISPILFFINIILFIYTGYIQLKELKNQRESLYYPHVSISGFPFVAKTNDVYVLKKIEKIPYLWAVDFKRPTLYYGLKDQFLLKIYNIGMGAAKAVSITWAIDYIEIIDKINRISKSSRCVISENKLIINKESEIPSDLFADVIDRFESTVTYDMTKVYKYIYDFIMQSKSIEDYASFGIPEVLTDLNSIYYHVLMTNKYDIYTLNDNDMISANVIIEFYDIANKPIDLEFKVVFKLQFIDQKIDENGDPENNYSVLGDIRVIPVNK